MSVVPVVTSSDKRTLWLGGPGANDSNRSRDEIRIIREMCSEDVEAFLTANAIDPVAAKELRAEPPHVALAVVERGPLLACSNPSGALMARIRDSKRALNQGPAPVPLDPNMSEGERFLATFRIDAAGVSAFMAEPPEMQKLIIEKGTLANSSNPSASLMARIKNLKAAAQQPQFASPLTMAGLVTGGGPNAAPAPGPKRVLKSLASPTLPPASPSADLPASKRLRGPSSPERSSPGPPPPPSSPPPPPPTGGSLEDSTMLAEALKAIQALNARGAAVA